MARAYIRPKLRRCWFLWRRRSPTKLRVHYRLSASQARMHLRSPFALAGQQEFTEYETLLCRVPPATVRKWLPLTEALRQREIDKRRCGVLYVEYATRKVLRRRIADSSSETQPVFHPH